MAQVTIQQKSVQDSPYCCTLNTHFLIYLFFFVDYKTMKLLSLLLVAFLSMTPVLGQDSETRTLVGIVARYVVS